MNKIYKVIWNKAIGTWVAVSENTKASTKTQSIKNSSPRLNITQAMKPSMVLKPMIVAMLGLSSSVVFAVTGVAGGSAFNYDLIPLPILSATAVSACISPGDQAQARGENAIAVGCNSIAAGANATSIGGFDAEGYANNLNDLGLANSTIRLQLGLTPTATEYNGSIVSRYSNSLGTTNAVLSGSSVAIGNRIQILNGEQINSLADLDKESVMYGDRSSALSVAIGDTVRIGKNSKRAIAIGTLSSVGNNAESAIALGDQAQANGIGSIAQGKGAFASSSGTVAIGGGGINQLNINLAEVEAGHVQDVGERKIVLKSFYQAGSTDKFQATVDGNEIILNYDNAGNITGGFAYLQSSQRDASGALIVVDPDNPTTYNSKVDLSAAEAKGVLTSLSTGGAIALKRQNVAIGIGSTALRSQSIAIGAQASAYGDQSLALGANTRTLGSSSIAIGGDDLITVNNNAEIRDEFKALTGQDLILSGQTYRKTTSGEAAIALGVQSQAIGALSTALGTRADATGIASTSVGTGAVSNKNGAVALGAGSLTDGNATKVTGGTIGVITLGGNRSDDLQFDFAGTGGFAGTPSDVGRQVSVGSIGNERQIKNVAAGEISKTSTDAINGSQLVAVVDGVTNYVNNYTTNLIGESGAVVYTTEDGTKVKKANNGNWYKATDLDANGDVIILPGVAAPVPVAIGDIITSVKAADGSTTTPTKLTNVADGDISATSTDAINGSQLNETINNFNTSINNNMGSIANYFGGGATYNPTTGAWTQPTYQVKNAAGTQVGTDAHDVGQALTNLNDYVNTGFKVQSNGTNVSTITPGSAVNFQNGTNTTVSVTETDGVTNVSYNVSDAAIINTTVNNAQTIVNNAQLPVVYTDVDGNKVYKQADGSWNTQADGSGNVVASNSIITSLQNADGSTTDPTKLTNVADGNIAANSKDAVNGGQIKNIADSIQTSIGGDTTVNADGSITTSNVGNTGKNNIHDAIDSVRQAAVAAKTTVTAGDNISVTPTTPDANGGSTYQVSLNKNLDLTDTGSVKTGNTTVNNSGLTIANTDPNKVVSVTDAGVNAGNNKVINVAPGTISSTSTDAVNGSQLNATNNAFNTFLGGNASYNDSTKTYTAPTYNINNGTTTNTYNNVGDALGALNQADVTINNRITNLGDQLEQSFRSTNNRIDDVEKRANAGIAAALALESAPYVAGKYTYAAGAAYHGDESAIGVTLRKTADNGRWSLTGGIAAATEGDASFRIGISGVID